MYRYHARQVAFKAINGQVHVPVYPLYPILKKMLEENYEPPSYEPRGDSASSPPIDSEIVAKEKNIVIVVDSPEDPLAPPVEKPRLRDVKEEQATTTADTQTDDFALPDNDFPSNHPWDEILPSSSTSDETDSSQFIKAQTIIRLLREHGSDFVAQPTWIYRNVSHNEHEIHNFLIQEMTITDKQEVEIYSITMTKTTAVVGQQQQQNDITKSTAVVENGST